jgi:4-deoxy-L-threo-5-hexosulose-uronate ketol-isomerase
MKRIYTADPVSYQHMTTSQLRSAFLLPGLFRPGLTELTYTDVDRAIVGGVVPLAAGLPLEAGKDMAATYFCERREVGVINLGKPGHITVDGQSFAMSHQECLYIGRGSRQVELFSDKDTDPALFYLVSYPAHASYPTTHASLAESNRIEAGSGQQANKRTIYQYVHIGPGGIKSCQLVLGVTALEQGSVWNSFPPHTHDRRTEVYCYFDLPDNGMVLHLMGTPSETRHVVVRNLEAVLSPPWSIHCGVGSSAYTFVWGMGGENQEFTDMDQVGLEKLA